MPSMYQTAAETKPADAADETEATGRRFEDLPAAAQRALREAEERRTAAADATGRNLSGSAIGRRTA